MSIYSSVSRSPHINEEPQNVSEDTRRNVLEEDIAACIELVNAFKCSSISTSQTLRQDSTLIDNKATDLPITSMTSSPHPTTMENLPDELLLDIFTRLLAKQLAQMRSVSKSWNARLSQSSFVKSHLDRSIQNNDQILLIFYDDVCYSGSKSFTAHPAQSLNLELTEFNKLPPVNPYHGHTNSIRVIGAVNGLICSCYGESVIQIWNPSLSAVSTLPPYHIPFRNPSVIKLRFGFDPKTDDYKVVKLTGEFIIEKPSADCMRFHLYNPTEWMQVEVYSMRKGSWELITKKFPSNIVMISDDNDICVDGHEGHLHWLGCFYRGKTYSDTIVTFNLGSETFGQIPLPDSIIDHFVYFNIIGVLAEKLCVMSQGENDAYEVWVMEDYGVTESWVKRHVFSSFNYCIYPFGFTSHNEFLFDDHDDCSLVFYDPIANKTKSFKKLCCRERHSPNKVVEYVDSLVWVGPAKRDLLTTSTFSA